MNKRRIYIYCIYFSTSNKYYIGQTYNLEKRILEHLRSGKIICNALYNYNNWKVIILHTCKSRDQANLIEIEEIRNFNCIAPNGYNLTRGGEGSNGYQWTEEHKQKQKERMQGNQHGKGYKHTKEAKEKMKGHKPSKETVEKIKSVMQGNKYAKGYKHTEEELKKMRDSKQGKINPSYRTDVKYKRLRTRLEKLEQELENK